MHMVRMQPYLEMTHKLVTPSSTDADARLGDQCKFQETKNIVNSSVFLSLLNDNAKLSSFKPLTIDFETHHRLACRPQGCGATD